MTDTFGTWLRIEIERRFPSQAEFARRIGVIPQAVNNWVLDKNKPELENVSAIARELGRTAYEVAERAGIELPGARPQVRTINDIMAEFEANAPVPVPVVEDITASMGVGVPISEYQYLPPQYRRRGNSIVAIRAKGRCMEPLITEGDYLIVDKNASWAVGDVVVAVVRGEVYAKRLAEVSGKEVLRGDADGLVVSLEDAEKDEGVVGRVIQITRPLDGVIR